MARSARPGRRSGRGRSGSIATARPRATSARPTVASLVRWRMSGSEAAVPAAGALGHLLPAHALVTRDPGLAGELGQRHGLLVPSRRWVPAGRIRCTGSLRSSWRSRPVGSRTGWCGLVAEHEVHVAQRQRREPLLGLGLDQLAAQLRCVARQRLDRRRGDTHGHGLERRDPPPARHGSCCRRKVRLGERGALEERLGVAHEDERGVGQAHPSPGGLQQLHPASLEHRELLRDGRRRELKRLGHGGDRPALVQLAQQRRRRSSA